MVKRKVSFTIFIIGIFCIISGSVASFLISLKDDKKITLNRMVVVNDKFEDFSVASNAFNKYRDDLHIKILNDKLSNNIFSQDSVIKDVLLNYENMVDNLSMQADSLGNLCTDVYYPDSNINSKCNNYKEMYEKINNCFVNDISFYNNMVNTYNIGKSFSDVNFLKKYDCKKKYIDYNNDNIFSEKESE